MRNLVAKKKSVKSRRRAEAVPGWVEASAWVALVVVGTAVGSLLARGLIKDEDLEQALTETVTGEVVERFMREHSVLEYRTREGDTLRAVAARLRRSGRIERIRAANPGLEGIGDDQPLEAGMVLKVTYNEFDVDELLAQDGEGAEAGRSPATE
ncbi:MAG: LysM peptidoglycan-binding domain-containing protein [bacterium]|nr:LysM peptidoglycan-binding domain-containing protein [bacterium]